MQITRMNKDDAAELAKLDKICFAAAWSEQSFREEADNRLARYFLAREDNRIIGYCGVWLVQDEGQITNIAVLPEYRRRGIATALLKYLIDECGECTQIVLEVRESNLDAIRLYEKFGFKKAGIRKNFYHSPTENGIVMIRGEF